MIITEPMVAVSSISAIVILHGKRRVWMIPRAQIWADPSHIYHTNKRNAIYNNELAYLREATAVSCANDFAVFVANNQLIELQFEHLDHLSASREDPNFRPSVRIISSRRIERPCESEDGDKILTVSCGDYHTAVTTIAENTIWLYLWGSNRHGQLRRKDKWSREIRLVQFEKLRSVICLKTATLMLIDGRIAFCGKLSENSPDFCSFGTIDSITPIISMKLIFGRVYWRSENMSYTHSDCSKAEPADEPQDIPPEFDTAITQTIHHEDCTIRVTLRGVYINNMILCQWNDFGGR